MSDGCFITLSGLCYSAVPIQIVDLQLYKLDFRMFGENLIQRFCIIMEGKADVLCFAGFLQLPQKFEPAELLCVDIPVAPHVMEQIQRRSVPAVP